MIRSNGIPGILLAMTGFVFEKCRIAAPG